ncbi:imidazolonepropionase [Clostridium estertheticum]|uniref:imidazolonepropionase n=1 Tax=Clostridium estertheticum TaxID=238834 RepID=UPI001CD13305|nr:imidazolonepropionase [Clostridium estertheticum]MBZ9686821.1 imidazolonepropionase [Clostridium estertheticum]
MKGITKKIRADLLIENCTQLLTCRKDAGDLIGLIENGYLAIAGEKIISVGTKEEVMALVDINGAEIIDGRGKSVAPGFVDAHTHLIFGGSRVKEYAARMITDDIETLERMGIKTGIMATVEMTRNSSEEALFFAASNRIKRMLHSGTTTVESKSGYGLSTPSEIKILEINKRLDKDLPMDVVSTFLGAHGWPKDISKERYMDMLVMDMIPYVAEEGLARFCDIWCDEGHFTAAESEKILKAAKSFGLQPKIHTDAYSYIGGSDLAAEMKMVSADHLNYTPKNVIRKLAEQGVPGVLLPAIDFAVKHPKPFEVRPMLDENLTIALATNCCPGCYVESMQFVMALACREHRMKAQEAIRAATLGGATALGLEGDRGSLEVNKLADIQIWDASQFEEVIYHIGGNIVEKVIKRGKVAFDNKMDF